MNNIAEAAESHYRTIISAQFEVILLFVLTCTFNAYTRLTGPRFREGSGRGMTLNRSRFFGIYRSAAIAALLFALLAVCTTPSAVWAVTSAILDTGRLYVDDVDLVVAARPVRLEVRRTLLARPDPHGLLAEELSEKILANLDTGSHDVTAQITGLVSFRHLDFVMRYFENDVDGIDKVHLNNFSEGVAELVLEYEGEPRILARQIAAK